MSIFTKPIGEITYEDVISFCQQGVGEGVSLDYKKDFPSSGLEKTISALANTFGGVILIGIEEEDSKPKPPFEGIEYKDKLEERVWNIILDNIYPPVFPEIRVCPPHDNKTFVIIRIPQSNETPHAIYNNTQVYLRTGNRNKPEDFATIEQIEWLRNRRKKSEELREMLYLRAEERYHTICEQKQVKIEFCEFTLSFAPLYPQKPLMTVEEIESIIEQIKVKNSRVSSREFPWLPNYRLKPIQDGMVSFFLNEMSGFITHTEVNKFGLIFYKESLELVERQTQKSETEKKLHMATIIQILDLSFEAAAKFYNKVGYWGLVDIKLSLLRLLRARFIPIMPKGASSIDILDASTTNDIEKGLPWHIILSVSKLNDPLVRQNKLLELGRDIGWSFGLRISEETIKQKLQEWGRWFEEQKEKV